MKMILESSDLTPLGKPHADLARVLAELAQPITTVIERAPRIDDAARWRRHRIGGHERLVARPVTLTPYASAQACSARCGFCSENLRLANRSVAAAALRPGSDYFHHLREALADLRGLPLGYSLSGLETSDNAAWMLGMLAALGAHAAVSPVEESVLYTNGAGLIGTEHAAAIHDALEEFHLTRIELSRHHFSSEENQRVMRFRPGIQVASGSAIDELLSQLIQRFHVRLVCIVQRGGIAEPESLCDYLEWAMQRGVRDVVFRELSALDDTYREDKTVRYLRERRVHILPLLLLCLRHPRLQQLSIVQATQGYYFWNVIAEYQGVQVTFEASDYGAMHRMHASGRVYKLVFHANGNLCAGWEPERDILRAGTARE